jgi:hypothetical protein
MVYHVQNVAIDLTLPKEASSTERLQRFYSLVTTVFSDKLVTIYAPLFI